jgi:Uma2 family endonuclease
VAEIKSPSDAVKDLQKKLQEWVENECRLGWLLDPDEKQVYVYTAGNINPPALPFGSISGQDVLPGLEIDLNEIFEN